MRKNENHSSGSLPFPATTSLISTHFLTTCLVHSKAPCHSDGTENKPPTTNIQQQNHDPKPKWKIEENLQDLPCKRCERI